MKTTAILLGLAVLTMNCAKSKEPYASPQNTSAISEAEAIEGNPFDEYYQINEKAHSQTVGFMLMPRFISDEEVVEEFDQDGDSSLSEEEEKAAYLTIKERRELLIAEKSEELLAEADTNDDGTIDDTELRALVRTKHEELKTAISEANAEMRNVIQEFAAEIRAACGEEEISEAPGKQGNGKPPKDNLEVSDEVIAESEEQAAALLQSCSAVSEEAQQEMLAAVENKKELIKNSIAEIQAIMQLMRDQIGSEELESDSEDKGNNKQGGKSEL